MSAERLLAGSITTDKVSSNFGSQLDLSSNTSIRLAVSSAVGPAIDSAVSDVEDRMEQRMDERIGYRMEIISTSDILSDAIRSTTLTARVWRGSQNVTDSLSASLFNWKRVSSDSMSDTIWNNNHQGMKSITITNLDVYYSATYSCELTSPS